MLALSLILAATALLGGYAYIGYPLLLMLVARRRGAPAPRRDDPPQWPRISITLPAYNAQATLRPVLDGLVALDYPEDRRQILVVSDGSTDGTDALVREYAARGVELLRIEGRRGKTEVENRAMDALTGEIVINTDASVTIRPDAVKHLVRCFADADVGVASARDVSVASVGTTGHASEAAYVGYEMWIRDLETRVSGIIGSSGCLYAIRASLHRRRLPGHLSRDFSSALWARLQGYRAVSVRDAVCFVPRAASMRVEYRRKIRTMSRGVQTLFYHAALLNPLRYGVFAWMLWSHKLIRWLVPWALLVGAVAGAGIALGLLRAATPWPSVGLALLGLGAAGAAAAALGWWGRPGRVPRLASMAAYFVSGTVAGLIAWKRALLDERAPVWDPTPRALSESGSA